MNPKNMPKKQTSKPKEKQTPTKGNSLDLNSLNKNATKESHQNEHTGSNKGSVA